MSPIRLAPLSSCAAVAAVLLSAATAHAAPVDGVVMDPSIGPQAITYHSLSNSTNTTLPVVFTPPTRDAFTKAAPLMLPCDVSFLAVGVSWKNVSPQSLFVEWAGGVFLNGDEHTKIPDGFGREMAYIADGRSWQPGQACRPWAACVPMSSGRGA